MRLIFNRVRSDFLCRRILGRYNNPLGLGVAPAKVDSRQAGLAEAARRYLRIGIVAATARPNEQIKF
jgi:hypothetical protein